MAKEVRYDYNGKEVGILSKTFKDIVVQEDWISTRISNCTDTAPY